MATCNKCNWVHFDVTREFAESEVKKFNEYFESLTEEQQDSNYGGLQSTLEDYEHCCRCGNHYKNFRESRPNDCPDGCTLSPIIDKNY
jgi:hypothetical protein